MCRVLLIAMLNVVMLSVIMLCVVMLNVVTPVMEPRTAPPLWVGSYLISPKNGRSKRSSLLCPIVSDEEKSFLTFGHKGSTP